MMRPSGKTLAQVVHEKALAAPSSPAIFHQDEAISYGELQQRVNQAARALLAMGVKPGDRVALLMGNEPDWIVVALAVSAAGALDRKSTRLNSSH